MSPERIELLKKASYGSPLETAKLRMTYMNNCSGHRHQKIDAMMTAIHVIYVDLFCFLRWKGRKDVWSVPQT